MLSSYTLLSVLALISLVSSSDLILGPNEGGRKILDELRKASPLLWKRENAVYVRTTDDEIINRIVITDERDNKDGTARVIEGGIGEKEALIELSSPGVLKGYEFHVQVYSVPNDDKNAASIKQVPNIKTSGGRKKRSWFGSSSDEDEGSFSIESGEQDYDIKVKPIQENEPNIKRTNENVPKTPAIIQSEISDPKQIADSIPSTESTPIETTTDVPIPSSDSNPVQNDTNSAVPSLPTEAAITSIPLADSSTPSTIDAAISAVFNSSVPDTTNNSSVNPPTQ